MNVTRTAPPGAKYVSVDKVGGKSIVWNQLLNPDEFSTVGCKATENGGVVTLTETAWNNRYQAGKIAVTKNHKYYQSVKIKSVRIDGDTPIYGVSVDTDANCCRIVFENQLTPGIIGSKNERVKSNIISDRLATISHADYWNNSLRASGINVYESLQAVCLRLHERTDIDTKEKAKAWLAENPTTVY